MDSFVRTPTIWLVGGLTLAAGLGWQAWFLALPFKNAWQATSFLDVIPGFYAVIDGFEFLRRPSLARLDSLLQLASFCSAAAAIQFFMPAFNLLLPYRLGSFLFLLGITLLILSAYIWSLQTLCLSMDLPQSRQSHPPEPNPWRKACGGGLILITLQIWLCLTIMAYWLGPAPSISSSKDGGLSAPMLELGRFLAPIIVAWKFYVGISNWLAGKARDFDKRRMSVQ